MELVVFKTPIYRTPVTWKDSFCNLVESYCDFSNIQAQVLPAQTLQGNSTAILKTNSKSLFATTLKIISYITILLPLIAFMVKKILRISYPVRIVGPMMHNTITNLLENLGHKNKLEGVCFGFSIMAMRAIALKQLDVFNNRLERLSMLAIKHNNDAEKILSDLKKDPAFYSECLAFFDGVVSCQSPYFYSNLFTPEQIPNTQKYSKELYELLKASPNDDTIASVKSFSGVYTHHDLETIFNGLQTTAMKKPLHIQLACNQHAILLSYDPHHNHWLYVDANYLPGLIVKNTASLPDLIRLSYHIPTPTTPTGLILEVLSSEEESEKIKEKLTNLIETTWHTILQNKNQECFERLSLACRVSEIGVIERLLQLPEIKNNINKIPVNNKTSLLHESIITKKLSVAEILLDHGANPNEKDQNGNPLLTTALVNNQVEIVKILLDHGANPNEKDQNNNSPLTKALVNNQVEMVKALLDHGADANEKDKHGDFPLKKAIRNNQVEIVQAIVQALVTKNVDLTYWFLPLTIFATKHNNPALTEILMNPKNKSS